MSDFSATIRTILDLSNIDAQLKAIESKSITLKSIKIDTTGIASQIQKAWKAAVPACRWLFRTGPGSC